MPKVAIKKHELNGYDSNSVVTPRQKPRNPLAGSANRLDQRAGLDIRGKAKELTKPTSWTAAELMAMDLPEPECVVHKLLTEGLNILVSRPKLGKSWLALTLSISVSTGTFALETLSTLSGDVLYLAMEDNSRRLKKRLSILLNGRDAPERLTFATEWPRMDDGGITRLREWVEAAERPRLIVIDTFAKVRSLKTKQADRYTDDYRDVGEVQRLAEDLGVAILVLHHDRKAQADDAMDDVSGSIGITAAADTILLMRRERGSHDVLLHVHGRDIDEQEIGLEWNPEKCLWSVMDADVKELRMSKERLEVLECIRANGPIGPTAISEKLKKNANSVKQLLLKLAKAGDVKSESGKYVVVTSITQ